MRRIRFSGVDLLPSRYNWFAIALLWALLLQLPKLYALVVAMQTDGVFAGSVVNIHDHNAYLASVQDGLQGNVWLGTLSFTTESNLPQALNFLHASLFYRSLGWLYGFTGLPINLFFLAIGLIAAFFAFAAFRRLFAECLSGDNERRIATASLFIFPGLLWVNQLLQEWPDAEAHVPAHILYAELWGNVSMNPIAHNIYMPHFVVANIGVALLGSKLVQTIRGRNVNHLAIAGYSLLISWLLPSLGALWVAVGASYVGYALLRWKLSWRCGTLMLLSLLPAGLMALWAYQFSFRSEFWTSYIQHAIAMTGVIDSWLLALHLGVFGPLALWGAWTVLRSHSKQDAGAILASIWLLWLIVLAVPSFTGSPRFMDGVYLPVIVLASRVLAGWRTSGVGWLNWRFALVGCLILPGTLITYTYPWIGHIFVHFTDRRINLLSSDLWPIRLSADEAGALEWIEQHADADGIVVSGPVFGSFVPGFTGERVYVGHIGRTLDFDRKLAALRHLDELYPLPGIHSPKKVWLVDTAREPLVRPAKLRTETDNLLCSADDFLIGDVTISQYIAC